MPSSLITHNKAQSTRSHAAIKLWLYLCAALVFCMVIVGGATRLTDSGLSITEWKPLLGAIPPLNAEDWREAFLKYQQIPEYKLQNAGMSLDEFKAIYWWEWAHRFLGRFIGIAFAVPFTYFAVTQQISRKIWPSLLVLFILGEMQGALGWYMVSSGLVDRVDVSQYRLAAHLSLAAIIYGFMLWVAFGIGRVRHFSWQGECVWALILIMLIYLQIAAGGFVAGLDAGMGYTTWPKMEEEWIPAGLNIMQPWWKNLFENALTVQFNHRLLAYGIFIYTLIYAIISRRSIGLYMVLALIGQISLGIFTLLWQVPLSLALLHQGGALIVLGLAIWNLSQLSQQCQLSPQSPQSAVPTRVSPK